MKTKNTPYIIMAAVFFMALLYWAGEQPFIYNMGESGQLLVSASFLAVLLTISYLIWKKD